MKSIDIKWCREHLPHFKKLEDATNAARKDSERSVRENRKNERRSEPSRIWPTDVKLVG